MLTDIEVDFRDSLKKLVPSLLAPENLRIKQIHGSNVTGRSLLEYFKVRTLGIIRCKTSLNGQLVER